MADNSKSSAMLECANPECGRRFAAIVSKMTRSSCPYCGAKLVPAKPKEPSDSAATKPISE
jgi:DNA-directed RNA polymerase subunit RPC12/RpoP